MIRVITKKDNQNKTNKESCKNNKRHFLDRQLATCVNRSFNK